MARELNTLHDYVEGFLATIEPPKKRHYKCGCYNFYRCNETDEVITVLDAMKKYNMTETAVRYRLNKGELASLTYTKVVE